MKRLRQYSIGDPLELQGQDWELGSINKFYVANEVLEHS